MWKLRPYGSAIYLFLGLYFLNRPLLYVIYWCIPQKSSLSPGWNDYSLHMSKFDNTQTLTSGSVIADAKYALFISKRPLKITDAIYP